MPADREPTPIRAVLDTNVLVSAVISERGAPWRVLRAWRRGAFVLVTSPPLLDELQRVLLRPHVARAHKHSEQETVAFAETLRERATVVTPQSHLDVIRDDPADNRVLEAAVAGAVDYIVSGDRHLLVLQEYAGIPIVSPVRFAAVLALA